MIKLNVFFSWEMETDPQGFNNKEFLIACINSALKELRKRRDFKNVEFEFQEGLSGVSGTPRVAEIMMKRARDCDIFIGDMTVAQRLGELTQKEIEQNKTFVRLSPNANVLMEYAIALNKRKNFWHQVILVMNTINGDVKDSSDLIPFDVREERHPIKFLLNGKEDEEKKNKLVNVLVEAIGLATGYALKSLKNRFRPLIGWVQQKIESDYPGKYEWTQRLEEYKAVLLSDKDTIRLIGLSGYGKTRLVLESFRKESNIDNYLYCDIQNLGQDRAYEMAIRVFEKFDGAVLVIDNCDQETHETLLRLRKSKRVKTKLITIYYDPNEKQSPQTEYVVMSELQNEVTERIFKRFRDFKDEEERLQFINSTGGNPMIAEHVVKSMMAGNDTGCINDTNFMTKLLGYDENSEEREALRALSVFAELEYDEGEEVHKELEFIATNKSILNIGKPDPTIVNWLTDMVKRQIKRGIIEKTGTTIRIRPQALSVGLFAEWVEHCDTGRIKKVIKDISNSPYEVKLSDAFVNQTTSLLSK